VVFQDAERVVKHGRHELDNVRLEVYALEDDSYLQHLGPCSISVTGLPSNVSKDAAAMFFESRKCEGGDCDVYFAENDGKAIVTFIISSFTVKSFLLN
jgi:hypothetical protein